MFKKFFYKKSNHWILSLAADTLEAAQANGGIAVQGEFDPSDKYLALNDAALRAMYQSEYILNIHLKFFQF